MAAANLNPDPPMAEQDHGPVQHFESQMGKPKIGHQGYYYNFHYTSPGDPTLQYWECEEKNAAMHCLGRIHARGNHVVHIARVHNHGPNPTKGEVLQAMKNLKTRAVSHPQEPVDTVVHTILNGLSEAAKAQMPSIGNLKRNVRRQRAGQVQWPALPRTLADLVLPNACFTLQDGRPFLRVDGGPQNGNNRSLLFITDQGLQLLSRLQDFYSDGKFSETPIPFAQLYTIHGLTYNTVVPLAYFLLPNKTAATYKRAIQSLKGLAPNWQPRSWLSDFEQAFLASLREEFPGIEITGCFYHYMQSLYRRIQGDGLAQAYANEEEFAVQCRLFGALAFVPLNDVQAAFDAVRQQPDFDPRLRPFLNYYEDTWLGRNGVNARFPPHLWNVNHRVLNEQRKTNNNVEGWHSGFNQKMADAYPSIYRMIELLKQEQLRQENILTQLLAGHPPPAPNRVYQNLNARVLRIVQGYAERPILEFLRAIAYNYRF